jgi:hypothetical protein
LISPLYVIGDKQVDVETAHAVGQRAFFMTGYDAGSANCTRTTCINHTSSPKPPEAVDAILAGAVE